MTESPIRKLAAIMFTDMVGYTALMQKDEIKARELIQRHRDLMKPHITKHGGKVLQFVGDGTFCTFDSAIEAVNAALEIQHVFKTEDEMALRIGIHVGDVVIEGEEVYGDGVNVASRIEPLAEPGGICVTDKVYDNLKNQQGMKITPLGEKELKNVEESLKVYSIEAAIPDELENHADSKFTEQKKASESTTNKLIIVAAGVIFLIILFAWLFPVFESSERALEASGEIRSIAILPLDNLSNDPDQEYFSDGMTEALIANIAKIRSLKVISRTSVMRYKGTDKSLPEIERELKVDAILEGSVMHAEGEVRVTVQLIRAATDEHLWANSYTDKLENILSLQSKIARAVAEEIKLTLSPEEEMNIGGDRKVNPEAYKLYLRAQKTNPWVQSFKEEEVAIKLLREAVAIDANFTDAWLLLSYRLSILHSELYDPDETEHVANAEEALNKAKALEPTKVEVELTEGHYHYYGNRDYVNALESYYRVLQKDPNNSVAKEHIGYVQRRMGKWESSLDKLLEAYKTDPYNLDLVRSVGVNYQNLRKFAESEVFFKKALDISPLLTHAYVGLAAIAFQKSGNPEDALEAMQTDLLVDRLDRYVNEKSYYFALSGNLDAVYELVNSYPSSEFRLGSLINTRNYIFGSAHYVIGDHAKAEEYFNLFLPELEIAHRLEPKKDKWMLYLSFSYAFLGRKEDAISVALNRAENIKISEDAFWGGNIEYDMAEIFMIVGELDKALNKVEMLLSIPSLLNINALEVHPIWKPLHDLPRYQEIIKKYSPES